MVTGLRFMRLSFLYGSFAYEVQAVGLNAGMLGPK